MAETTGCQVRRGDIVVRQEVLVSSSCLCLQCLRWKVLLVCGLKSLFFSVRHAVNAGYSSYAAVWYSAFGWWPACRVTSTAPRQGDVPSHPGVQDQDPSYQDGCRSHSIGRRVGNTIRAWEATMIGRLRIWRLGREQLSC